MKKLVSLICALALLLCLVPSSFAETTSSEAPVEITYFRQDLARNSIAYYSDAAWFQELEKRLNVKIKIIGPASTDDYNTAVNIMLVSGDYPDLLFFDWNNYNGGAEAGVEDGIILPISTNPDYKAKVPNWFNIIDSNENIRRAVTLDDGSIDFFCHYETNIARSAYWGYAIRKDWLDRLNLAVPTTIDELYTVLKAFKEQDANGNGDPNDEIPLTSCNWWTTVHPMMDSLSAAFGLKVNTMYRDPQTGKMTYWTEYNDGKNFKDYVTTMRKWYSEGLIDPEYVSQKYEACSAKITGDKAGVFFCFPDSVLNYKKALKATMTEAGYANPDDVMIYGLVPLAGSDGVPYAYDADNAMVSYAGSSQPTVITTAAVKHGTVDKCLELINYLYSDEGSDLINWGVEGVSYTKDADGTKHWTDLVTKDPDYSMSDAVFKYALPTLGAWPKAMSYEAWASLNLIDPDAVILHQNYAKGDPGLLKPTFSLTADEAETYNRIITDVNTAVSEVYLAVITGTRPLEDLDTLLTQVDEMGIQEAIDCYQTAYERYLAK
jgi:putative aldouronate transport system substrate-binding protein